jgi:hypothetical protein
VRNFYWGKHDNQGRRRKMLKLITVGAFATACLGFTAPVATADSPKLKLMQSDTRTIEGRATRTGLKLLKTWVKDGGASSELGDPIGVGTALPLPGGQTAVKCPNDTRCMIELTLNVTYAAAQDSSVVAAWKVDSGDVEAGGATIVLASSSQDTLTWTFSKNLGAGSHTVIPAIGCGEGTCVYAQHSLVIRLYKR